MKTTTAITITGLLAGVVDLFTRDWVRSPKLGASIKFSLYLKLVLTLMGTYAMLSQFACVVLMIYWILT